MKPPTRKHWIDDFSYKEGYADGYAHHKRESKKEPAEPQEPPDKGDMDGRER
jgi:hypothetical protein